MTPDERNLLQRFLQDLGQTRGALKDAQADAMITFARPVEPDPISCTAMNWQAST